MKLIKPGDARSRLKKGTRIVPRSMNNGVPASTAEEDQIYSVEVRMFDGGRKTDETILRKHGKDRKTA